MTFAIQHRPINALDTNNRPIYDSVDDLALQIVYNGSNPQYIGFARPGSDVNAPVWKIFLLTYTGSNLTSRTWPLNDNGVASNDYEFVFANAASYTYA